MLLFAALTIEARKGGDYCALAQLRMACILLGGARHVKTARRRGRACAAAVQYERHGCIEGLIGWLRLAVVLLHTMQSCECCKLALVKDWGGPSHVSINL